MKSKLALVIGNTDGIGLALTKKLLSMGWQVIGLSKSPSLIIESTYRHVIVDVTADDFIQQLRTVLEVTPDVSIYCAGIGEKFDVKSIEFEQKVFQVNLMGAVKTIEAILPALVQTKSGQIIVISSLADEIVSSDAPSYSASKGGLSSYVEGLALAVRKHGVSITNVRFGFVDTKMAKGEKLLMMTVENAVDHLLQCIKNRPIRYSRPRLMAVLVLLVRWFMKFRLSLTSGMPPKS
ncbi:MAG: SDR family NAD(P)-dependent oxidoreductase [candidate division Zixibacteria bacterium]|nr:SDR family NAD(P)-dependent oxidoreductase [candidate division Zixibacteria bacterium]